MDKGKYEAEVVRIDWKTRPNYVLFIKDTFKRDTVKEK